jgi:hypothetical protein
MAAGVAAAITPVGTRGLAIPLRNTQERLANGQRPLDVRKARAAITLAKITAYDPTNDARGS